MISRHEKMCGTCGRLNTSDAEQREQGRGLCTGHEQPDDWKDWSEPFCVLFTVAQRMSTRKAWIMQIQQREALLAPVTTGECNERPE